MSRPEADGVLALVDSGTTRTRVRLWEGQRLRASFECPLGARDVAASGSPEPLRSALNGLLAQARRDWNIRAVVCWGMITSEVGLLEVPHVAAPADETTLARGLRRLPDPDTEGLSWYFLPGVRTGPPQLSWETLDLADLMRGEEVQVLGLRASLGLEGPALFLHLGSHHKLVWTSAAGQITRSRTALSGELLAALAEHSVLRASVGALSDWPEPDEAPWRAGLAAAQAQGLGRALFTVRLGHVLLGADREQLRAYLLGVLARLTLDLLPEPEPVPLLLSGAPGLAVRLAGELGRLGWPDVRLVSPEQAERASALGARRVLAAHQSLTAT